MVMNNEPTAHEVYLGDPTPGNLKAVVDFHKSHIDGTVNRMVGQVSPVVKTRAYLLAAEAIKKYDPAHKVPLKHWIAQGLQPIHRTSKRATEIIGIPEALRREAAHLARSRDELKNSLYRDPSDEELADHSGIPIRKQQRIAKGLFWTQSEGAQQARAEAGGDEGGGGDTVATPKDAVGEVQDYVYHDLQDIDRLIFQHRLGYNGAEVLPNIEIARRVNLSPAAVTQRADRIQKRLEEAYSWR